MFDGFESSLIDVGETSIFIRRAGGGAPLLLLHGFPETHLMWHRVAPALTDAFTVVCADLRGYGASGKPASRADHAPYAKGAMALDMVRVMESLGFPRFALVGHDRGARVAYRLALDHPERVEALGLFDIVPTSDAFRRADSRFALGYWPWSLLAQPSPLPERLILGAPDAIVDAALTHWGSDAGGFSADVRAAYVDALRDPDTVHAICEEYRAAATIDVEMDVADYREHRRIACRVLCLWGAGGAVDSWYTAAGGPLGIWREWADEVRGRPVEGGHFFPETNPEQTIAELRAFLIPD